MQPVAKPIVLEPQVPGIVKNGRRLGRKKSADPRDNDYLAIEHIPEIVLPKSQKLVVDLAAGVGPRGVFRSPKSGPEWARDLPTLHRYHARGPQLDQGGSSQCVIYTLTQLMQSGPIMQRLKDLALANGNPVVPTTQTLEEWMTDCYTAAQASDEWAGAEPTYYGTSGRAGAQVMRAMGFWPNFFWLRSIEEIARYVVLHGPVPVGTDWFTQMDNVDARGYLVAKGEWRGGHEWLIDGVNIFAQFFRMRQSWGDTPYTSAKVSFLDMKYLLSQGGDALAIPEVRVPRWSVR